MKTLHEKGMMNSMDILGEDTQSPEDADRAMGEYLEGLDNDFPMDENAFVSDPAYLEKVKNTMETDLSAIPWWDRKLDYPPDYYPRAGPAK